jgi:hypothetical protein
MRLFRFAALILLLLAAPVAAQTVSGLTVMAGDPPKVTATYPAQDQAVKPGVLVLKVTFNQKMLPSGFNIGPSAAGDALECVHTPRLLNDAKTFVLLCRAWPNKTYGVSFNGDDKPGFVDEGDRQATPATLTFTTTGDEAIRTLDLAMKASGLTEIDNPIEETTNPQPPAPVVAATAPAPAPPPHPAASHAKP